MSVSFDFTIISDTSVPGISLVMAQNEAAYSYLTDEEEYTTLMDGSAPIRTEFVGDFISDAEQAQFCSNYI